MPALPEIEVIRRDLEREVATRRIKSAEIRPGSNAMKIIKRHGRRKEFQDLLVGAKIESVDRKGRKLFLALDNGHVLVLDLGEKGQLYKTSASDPLLPHTHVIVDFTIGGQLRVLDPVYDAEVFVVPRDEYESSEELRPRGIDPLDNTQPFTWHEFSSVIEQRDVTMRDLLTDDNVIVGLGDVYADEVLFAAGIRFDRRSQELTSQDVRRLYRALFETLQEAVKARGTSRGDDGFRDLHGGAGAFEVELKVFERAGESCRRCRSEIVRQELGGRYTYFCPQCQS